MRQIFIDTNVIIDFLADSEPYSDDAAILFQLAKEKKIRIQISAISFNNTYYILRKVTSHKRAIGLISEIEEFVGVQEMNRSIIRKALKSNFNDFEDAIQYYSAVEIGDIDIITTRDLKDFKKSEISVLSPETTVKILLKELI
ncbi:MAG: PIN domain-containing protein [Prolixibacteraceae bacterium]|nr:PIN domain-containing protein [Prolixibacteraceae bacterium]